MNDCLNGSTPKTDILLDAEKGGAPDHSAAPPMGSKPPASSSSKGMTIWLILTTLIAIAALILGAWATDKALKLDDDKLSTPVSNALTLASNPNVAARNGLTVVGNLHAGSGYWALRTKQMMVPRSDLGVVNHKNEIYVFGGINNASQVLGTMTKFNMYKGTEVELDAMPEPRYRFGYAVLGNKLYVFGGFSSLDDFDQGLFPDPSAATMIFDFDTHSWARLAAGPVLNFPRPDLSGAAANGKVYALGGFDVTSASYDAVGIVEELDPAIGVWKRVADMPIARGDFRAVSSGGVLYALGGIVNADNQATCDPADWFDCHPWTASVWAWNPAQGGGWQQKASMILPRGDFAAVVMPDGHILVAGGELNYTKTIEGTNLFEKAVDNQVALPNVERYMPDVDRWVPKARMFSPRFRFDMASDAEGFVYAFGGAPTCEGNGAMACHLNALPSIMSFNDVVYHDVWVVAF